MSLSIILVYLIATITLSLTPGPTMLLALSNGTTRNKMIVIMGIVGAGLGNVIIISAVSLGLGAMMRTSLMLFDIVKWVGTAYLVWLAIQLWRKKTNVVTLQCHTNKTVINAFNRSLLVAVSNPKGLLFFTAFLPQFIVFNQPLFMQYCILAGITIIIDSIVMIMYAFGGTLAGHFLTNQGLKRLNQCCAIVMFGLAILLAFYQKN